jgi:molybdenum cofactor synthesis domain-containing protein
MTNPTAAMLVIGDEILSGRTRDANMHYLAGQLTAKGIQLKEVRVVSDDAPAIIAAVQTLSGQYTHVFTSGGIGPTHDDITADCIAAAFDRHIDVRDDARQLLADFYRETGRELNDARLRMARIPGDAILIDNPVSIAPGFQLENVYVMAGVPSVFQAMVASVLPQLTVGQPLISENIRVLKGEGDIAAPLGELAAQYADLQIGSYPFQQDGRYGTNIVLRGTDPDRLQSAMAELKTFAEDV